MSAYSTYGKTHTSRRLVQGVGIYDSPDNAQRDPLYKKWHGMFGRCYGARSAANASYAGCTVHPEWHSFMAFKAWANSHDWVGKQLDKDLLVPGNKVYGPETCCFVPRYINMIGPGLKGRGVAYYPGQPKPFVAQGRSEGKSKWLGAFATEEEAISVWKAHKVEVIRSAISTYKKESSSDSRVVKALELLIVGLQSDKPLEW